MPHIRVQQQKPKQKHEKTNKEDNTNRTRLLTNINSSRGILALHKYFCYLIIVKWGQQGQAQMITIEETLAVITSYKNQTIQHVIKYNVQN